MENATAETHNELTDRVMGALKQLLDAKFPHRSYAFRLEPASRKGDNYIGVVHRVVVELNDNATPTFSLILKVPPRNALRREKFFAKPCFLRESLAYEEFLPLVSTFQQGKGPNAINSAFREYPECYCSLTDDHNEAVFLEDLRAQNFGLFDRFAPLPRGHVVAVMRAYAKLHAVSFALKDQRAPLFQRFQQMQDLFQQRKDDAQLGAYFEGLKGSARAALSDRDQDKPYGNILRQYFGRGTFMQLLLELIDGASCEPYAVVCHGDCWINNMLFKQANGGIADVRLIDWQVMRYASPITDLVYFLFTCTTGEFRREHYMEMLDVYYEELAAHVRRLDSDPTVLFPRSVFDGELKRRGAVGLLLAMMVIPIITLKNEDAPSLEELSKRIAAGATTDLQGAGLLAPSNLSAYNARMRDTIMDCINWGYI